MPPPAKKQWVRNTQQKEQDAAYQRERRRRKQEKKDSRREQKKLSMQKARANSKIDEMTPTTPSTPAAAARGTPSAGRGNPSTGADAVCILNVLVDSLVLAGNVVLMHLMFLSYHSQRSTPLDILPPEARDALMQDAEQINELQRLIRQQEQNAAQSSSETQQVFLANSKVSQQTLQKSAEADDKFRAEREGRLQMSVFLAAASASAYVLYSLRALLLLYMMCSQFIVSHTYCSKKKARDPPTPDSDRKMPPRPPTPGVPESGFPSFGGGESPRYGEIYRSTAPPAARGTGTGITASGFIFDSAAAPAAAHGIAASGFSIDQAAAPVPVAGIPGSSGGFSFDPAAAGAGTGAAPKP